MKLSDYFIFFGGKVSALKTNVIIWIMFIIVINDEKGRYDD